MTQRFSSPLFVLGTQRSGTTLLCRMLSAHPDLFIQNELNVRKMFPGKHSAEDIERTILQLIEQDHAQPLEQLLTRDHKRFWGLKDPELTGYIDQLEWFIPGSKFVVIVRDARAVVNSYIDNKWGLGTNAYTGALRWLSEVTAQEHFYKRHPHHVHLLKYEDLVVDPESELRALLSFIGLPFSTDMLRYFEKPAQYHQTRENATTFQSPDTAHIEKWRAALSTREQRIVNAVCGPMMNKLGYQHDSKCHYPNKIEKAWYTMHQKILGELQIQYRWRASMVREFFRRRKLRRQNSLTA